MSFKTRSLGGPVLASEYRNGESGLLRKARHYLGYADRRLRPFKDRWPEMDGFLVLFVLANGIRSNNFLKALADHYPHRLFLVTDRASASEDWERCFADQATEPSTNSPYAADDRGDNAAT